MSFDITAPEPINLQHNVTDFHSGEESLDKWLIERSLKNEKIGASRTYVVCHQHKVIAYYCLAVGALAKEDSIGKIKRNMPSPIPVMIIGRLAVDKARHGKGIGKGLLRDAILRTLQVSEIAGIRAILVHAISEGAKSFYLNHGFHSSPINPRTLMIGLDEIKNNLKNN
ncbi:MAG: GNAT family N-acetyltransferase [Methylococcaceae bacterium]|nr:GNAT family N-acetyltransferase [Methylococcaceae bacterium]